MKIHSKELDLRDPAEGLSALRNIREAVAQQFILIKQTQALFLPTVMHTQATF